jgi:hypothetical protein
MPPDSTPPSGALPPNPADQPANPRIPFTIADILDATRTYKPEVLRALTAFKREKPWAGTPQERAAKLRSLHSDLCIAYRMPNPPDIYVPSNRGGGYDIASNTIHVGQNLSVLTYLHSFAMSQPLEPKAASGWSVNLFKRMFPASYNRLVAVGPYLVRPADVQAAREALGITDHEA